MLQMLHMVSSLLFFCFEAILSRLIVYYSHIGYTSATFSGRCAMPLLADTIVACGRSTLRQAIVCANQWGRENGPWNGANVVYGDTDSLFVTLPGRSHKEGFDFGEQLCEAVRMASPPPVELKLEKVYVQSIMQTVRNPRGKKLLPSLQQCTIIHN